MVCVLAGLAACSGDDAGSPPPPPPVTLTSIAVSPPAPSLAAGTGVQLSAVGMFSNATTSDVSAQVTWSSSADAVATVTAAGLVTGVAAGTATIDATVSGVTGHAVVTVTSATLTELQVTPANPRLALGTTTQLTAMGVFTDHSKQDLTGQVAWASDNEAHATVALGTVTAVAVGDATISATLAGVTGSTTVTTTAAVIKAITVAPEAGGDARIALGLKQQLKATATFTDDTQQNVTADAVWTSSLEAVATVGVTGLVTSHGKGTATITATLLGQRGALDVTITDAVLDALVVTADPQTVAAGLPVQFTATGTLSDGTHPDLTTLVTWTTPASANPVAVVSNADGTRGLATTRVAGQVRVTATLPPTGTQGTVTGSFDLTVTDATLQQIDIAPVTATIPAHGTIQFIATGHYTDGPHDVTAQATWRTDDLNVATISSARATSGLATGGPSGTTIVHGSFGGFEATATLTVTPAVLQSLTVAPEAPSVPAGLTVQLTATGHYDDGTSKDLTGEVTWGSSDATIATVAADGLVSGLVPGTVTITASSAIAGVTPGSVVLTVAAPRLDSIEVAPGTASVAAGRTVQFVATGTFSDSSHDDISTRVAWAPVDDPIAAVSATGLATTRIPGAVTVTATLDGHVGRAELTVDDPALDGISISPVNPVIGAHGTLQFQLHAQRSDGTTPDVTTQAVWNSSDVIAATIEPTGAGAGLARGGASGTTTITATFGGLTATTQLTVTPAVLQSISIDPATASVAKGLAQQFTATGHYDDATTKDLTGQVAWSSDPAIATVSPVGVATTLAVGTTAITATLPDVEPATATLVVTEAVPVSIAVTPSTVTLTRGGTQQFTAIATLTDGDPQDVTATAIWRSNNPAIATVVTPGGLATAVAGGTTEITATVDRIAESATVNVVGPSVTTTLPRDTAFGIRAATPIVVAFSQPLAPASLTTQTAGGACSGSLQVSGDQFATCVAFNSPSPSLDALATTATAVPAAPLAPATVYQIRVLGSVTNASGDAAVPFTQPAGFTTFGANACGGRLVISQVYGGGGDAGATYSRDFIELHNSGNTPVNLGDFALQAPPIGTSNWQITALPAVTIPPGGYYLVGEGDATLNGKVVVADLVGTLALGTTTGKVALTASKTPLPSDACPLGLTNDLVGYGTMAACAEGRPTTNLSNVRAAARGGAGCTDTEANSTDFGVATPAPRNSTTPPHVCTCP